MIRIFYTDPQSYNNLAVYDHSLLSCTEGCEITYFHNAKYQCGRADGVTYKSVFSYSDIKNPLLKGASYALSVMRVILYALKERPSIVHIQWFRLYPVDVLQVRLLHAMGARIVHTAHNVLPHNPKASDKRRFGWYYGNVDAIIVHTERSKREIENIFGTDGSKIHVIPHGMLPPATNEASVRERAHELKRKHQTGGKVVFASMGYQNYYKGIDIITDVWSRNEELHSSGRCMLLVIGKVQNADIRELEKFDNVVVVNDLVPDVDFDAYLSLASVALLPYREISQSGVLFTALERQVPVIVSDAGGLKDPLDCARVGWSIGEATPENLEKRMLQLAADPKAIDEVRDDTEAFEKVRDAFSWKRIGELTSRIYKELAEGQRRQL